MPRPRDSTEMRPSMPARKRWPFLNGALFSCASRSGAFLPPRCGMHTTLTPEAALEFTIRTFKVQETASAGRQTDWPGGGAPQFDQRLYRSSSLGRITLGFCAPFAIVGEGAQ